MTKETSIYLPQDTYDEVEEFAEEDETFRSALDRIAENAEPVEKIKEPQEPNIVPVPVEVGEKLKSLALKDASVYEVIENYLQQQSES